MVKGKGQERALFRTGAAWILSLNSQKASQGARQVASDPLTAFPGFSVRVQLSVLGYAKLHNTLGRLTQASINRVLSEGYYLLEQSKKSTERAWCSILFVQSYSFAGVGRLCVSMISPS